MINVVMKATRSAPRSDPGKSHDFLPSAKPMGARLAALFVRENLPSFKNDAKPSQDRVPGRGVAGRRPSVFFR